MVMTKEQAIKFLELDKEDRGKCFISDAIDMAIKALEQEPIIDKIWSIVYPLSIMSTDKMEHEAIMQIAEMLEPLCLLESER